MKKVVYTIVCFAFSLVFLAAYLPDWNAPDRNLIAWGINGDVPALPEQPYDYQIDMNGIHELVFNYRFLFDPGEIENSISDIDNDIATLGRVLFYDKMLSSTGKISCGSCHIQSASFADTVAFSMGTSQPTKRNSQHLNDLIWAGDADFFWDKKQGTLREMIELPLKDENEIGYDGETMIAMMNSTSYYPELFEKAYGHRHITELGILKALEQFTMSIADPGLTLADSIYAGILNREMTEEESLGFDVYSFACQECHAAAFYEEPNNNGLDSIYLDKGAGLSREDDAWNDVFKSPHLRNVAFTAPYMHDGRYQTLEQVVEFYSDSVHQHEKAIFMPPQGSGYEFGAEEKQALLTFLKKGFINETILTHPRWSDPFAEQISTSVEQQKALQIHIYPNPGTHTLKLELGKLAVDALVIVDQQGRLVQKVPVANQTTLRLDVGAYSPGTYFVETTGSRKVSGKFVVLPH
ncbi:MAG: cytochrome c peroxidase [Bacteroidota bacterium]